MARGAQWSAAMVRAKGSDFLLVALYMIVGIGPHDGNLERLDQVASLIKSITCPWVIAGDFNMTPEELMEAHFVKGIEGAIMTPCGVSTTCSGERIIDYCIVHPALLEAVDGLALRFEAVGVVHV